MIIEWLRVVRFYIKGEVVSDHSLKMVYHPYSGSEHHLFLANLRGCTDCSLHGSFLPHTRWQDAGMPTCHLASSTLAIAHAWSSRRLPSGLCPLLSRPCICTTGERPRVPQVR